MVNVIFHAIRNWSNRKEFAPSGSKFFHIREVSILKKDAIEQKSPFEVLNFFTIANSEN